MAAVTIRNLPDETHRALKIRAATNGRSTEAEIRAILEAAAHPQERLRLGTALHDLTRRIGLTDDEVATIAQRRDGNPAEPMRLE
ncbi:putative plasmid stability protein y4jJ [Asticcacaulis biprosthecium C19]|uniref:Putative plasmid stability protein y4jJ n=1 Tax=Asticcacaulis biprosthecium C19 TaxID=715226 RepID=F4QQL3_9CAUL|nr:hypothetical protein [Asticcacaulis biprosthecium]EGF90500.1 putative plasmid stability protein y4jJ [Asticcacaulis biprosthecium C19]